MSESRRPKSKNPDEKLDFDVRPIGARALKSARDTLRPYLADSRVLDLFAGHGRFGIAALEEEATEVYFIELNKPRARELGQALKRYGNRAKVLVADALGSLTKESLGKFDLIFADPPYPYWNEKFIGALFRGAASRLEKGAIFLVKHPTRVIVSVPNKELFYWKSVPFGEATLAYYKYATESEPKLKDDPK